MFNYSKLFELYEINYTKTFPLIIRHELLNISFIIEIISEIIFHLIDFIDIYLEITFR